MWLLEETVFNKLQAALEAGLEQNWLAAGGTLAINTQAAPRVADGLAVIPVKGILTKQADPLIQFFFGANTAYDDIIAQIGQAERNSKVTAVRFDIDSPGGNTDGLFDTLAAINAMTKPATVYARNANSAAYGIAAAAGNITAANAASTFGSVGILAKVSTNDSVHTITSSSAPDKAPDPRTEEGHAAIVRHLDAIEDLFVGAIADGRGITADAVRQGFGRGATLLANEAKSRGMIDGIAGTELRVVNTTQATAEGGSEAKMDLEQLKVEHPAVYKAALDVGVKQERDRVTAHLQGGEMSGTPTGGLKIALDHIRAGDDITQTVSMEYLTAAHNARDVAARDEDEAVIEAATNGAAPKKVDEMEELQGKTLALLKGMVGEGDI